MKAKVNKNDVTRNTRMLHSVGAACFYGIVSIALTLLNKALFSTFEFKDSRILGIGQMLGAIIFLFLFDASDVIKVPPVSSKTISHIWPLAASYISMLVFGFAAMKGTNIVMLGTLRRTAIILVLVFEFFLLGKSSSRIIVFSTVVMVVGVVTAGSSDLSYDPFGYLMAMLTNIATAVYIVLIKYYKRTLGLDAFGMLLYNAILSAPPLIVFSFFCGDFSSFVAFEHIHNVSFWLIFLLSCSLGFVINYAVFLNTAVNSPLTQTVSGQLKDILVLIFGILIFRDVKFSLVNTVGVCLSLFGSFIYAFAKFKEISRGLPTHSQSGDYLLKKLNEGHDSDPDN